MTSMTRAGFSSIEIIIGTAIVSNSAPFVRNKLGLKPDENVFSSAATLNGRGKNCPDDQVISASLLKKP